MNGRIYDPLLGRFLSADRVVEDGFDLQTYNRYTYVRNNPLTLTDPNGEFVWFIPLAIYVGKVLIESAVETGVEAGISKATGDENFSGGNAFVRNAAVNAATGWIPGATEGKIATKLAIRAAKAGAETVVEASVETAQGNGTFTENLVQTGVGNLVGEGASALADKAVKIAADKLKRSDATDRLTSTDIATPAPDDAGDISNIKNGHLAGLNHPDTGVPFGQNKFPIFDSYHDVTLPDHLRGPNVSDADQFKHATENLRETLENDPKLKAEMGLSDEQWEAIQSGSAKIPGFTWHHHEDKIRLQMVDEKLHAKTGHSGGRQNSGGRP